MTTHPANHTAQRNRKKIVIGWKGKIETGPGDRVREIETEKRGGEKLE